MATTPRKSATKPIAPPKAKRADWDAIERDYRTAKFTLRELATKHGVTHTTISRKAEKLQWSKDLSEAIRQATNTKLVQQAVQQQCTTAHQNATEAVLVAAEVNTQVILGHRQGLNEITQVKRQLLAQVQQAAVNLPELQDIIEMVRKPDENGHDKVNDALKKALGRSALIDDLKKLSEVDERVRKGEREAFGLEVPGALAPPGQKRYLLEFVDVEPRFE